MAFGLAGGNLQLVYLRFQIEDLRFCVVNHDSATQP